MEIPTAYVVVNFTDSNTVECVPYNWLINNKKCKWPPYTNDKYRMTKAISCSETAGSNWETFRICILYGTGNLRFH